MTLISCLSWLFLDFYILTFWFYDDKVNANHAMHSDFQSDDKIYISLFLSLSLFRCATFSGPSPPTSDNGRPDPGESALERAFACLPDAGRWYRMSNANVTSNRWQAVFISRQRMGNSTVGSFPTPSAHLNLQAIWIDQYSKLKWIFEINNVISTIRALEGLFSPVFETK